MKISIQTSFKFKFLLRETFNYINSVKVYWSLEVFNSFIWLPLLPVYIFLFYLVN